MVRPPNLGYFKRVTLLPLPLKSIVPFSTALPPNNPSNLASHYFSLLHSCPNSRHLRHLHAQLLRNGLYGNVILSSKLLLMYSKHNRLLTHSHPVFLHMPQRNIYSWNIMIGEFSRSGFPDRSIDLFLKMHSSGVPADAFTAPVVLRSCAMVGSAGMGVATHAHCVRTGLERSLYVASALVFFYVSLSRVSDARFLFDGMPVRDSVLWTTMLSGYAQRGETEMALGVFREMVGEEGIELDVVVMVSLLLVCGRLGWNRHGKSVHGYSVRKCQGLGLSLGNALVDMYVKCGAFSLAERVFSRMASRDVISWSALILGHGLNGHADFALELFGKMLEEGVRPNSVTYLGVLSACSHAGLVEKAWAFLDMMRVHGVDPELKHYACMVDVMGRAGKLVEAEKFIEEMPMEPDEAVWGALLAGCHVHGNVRVGERVSKRLLGLRPDKSGYYVLLANLYSEVGRFDDAEEVREFMKQMKVGKVPGHSLIELDGILSLSQEEEVHRSLNNPGW